MIGYNLRKRTFREKWQRVKKGIWQNRGIYVLAFLPLVWFIIFDYGPMGGLSLAFKTYKTKLGIWASPWVGLKNFKNVFSDPQFFKAVRITLWINLVEMAVYFPIPIIMAVALNELRLRRIKKSLQTIVTFPHFLSWVVVGSILKNLLSMEGPVNGLLNIFGFNSVVFLSTKSLFRPLIYITLIWKETGWDAIIYMAAISGIDEQQYEAATIDGASRFQCIASITLPSIMPTIAIMLILRMGSMMAGHYDQIFNMQNDLVRTEAETLAMYVYRITFERTPNYGTSTAVSLFSSVINMVLMVSANFVSRRVSGNDLLGGVGF